MNAQEILAGRKERLANAVAQARNEIQHSNAKAMLLKLNEIIGHEFSLYQQNVGCEVKILGDKVIGFGYIIRWLGAEYSFYQIDFIRHTDVTSTIILQDEIFEFVGMIQAERVLTEEEAIDKYVNAFYCIDQKHNAYVRCNRALEYICEKRSHYTTVAMGRHGFEKSMCYALSDIHWFCSESRPEGQYLAIRQNGVSKIEKKIDMAHEGQSYAIASAALYLIEQFEIAVNE